MSDAASILAAVEYLCVKQKEEQEEEWYGDGAVLLKTLPSEIWYHILSFVDPWTLVSSVSCVSKRFQQLFRMQMQTSQLRQAFSLNDMLANDSDFLATLVMTLRLLCQVLQHPNDRIYLSHLLFGMKTEFRHAVLQGTLVSYHILCKPWAQKWLDTSCLIPFLRFVTGQDDVDYVVNHQGCVAAERIGLLLFMLERACKNRLGHPLVFDELWKLFLSQTRSTLNINKSERKELSVIPITRTRRDQSYTIERRNYQENIGSRISINHPLLLRSAVANSTPTNTDMLILRFASSEVYIKSFGDMHIVTECKEDAVIDETVIQARYVLVPFFEKNLD